MKRLAILGSTGSIGTNALAVVAQHPGEFTIVGLAAGRQVEVLARQVRQCRPARVSVQDEDTAARLRELLGEQEAPDPDHAQRPGGGQRLYLYSVEDHTQGGKFHVGKFLVVKSDRESR